MALTGFGLAHLLGGLIFWTLLSGTHRPDDLERNKIASILWFAPADLLSEDSGQGLQGPPKPVPASAAASKPAAPPAATAKAKSASPPPPAAAGAADTLRRLEQAPGAPGLLAELQKAPAPKPSPVPAMELELPPEGPPASAALFPRPPNKYITLSAVEDAPPPPQKPVLNLLDIANLNSIEQDSKSRAGESRRLDAVDAALQKALLDAWKPPAADLVPRHQRRATVELSVLRDGTLKNALLMGSSGSSALDDSITALLQKLTKISQSLPASYPKDRYAVRVNLQIE